MLGSIREGSDWEIRYTVKLQKIFDDPPVSPARIVKHVLKFQLNNQKGKITEKMEGYDCSRSLLRFESGGHGHRNNILRGKLF